MAVVKTSVSLPEETVRRLRSEAKKRKMSMSAIIQEAVDKILEAGRSERRMKRSIEKVKLTEA